MKIFLSYAHKNEQLVLDLMRVLNAHDVWMDERLNIGDTWWDKIEQQIASSHCVMLAVSEASLTSEYCRKEIDFARKLNKPIAPVVIEACSIPNDISRLQLIDISNGLTSDATLDLLNGLFEIERSVINPLKPSDDNKHKKTLDINELTFITTNATKKADYEAILGISLQTSSIQIQDIQHQSVEEVALAKVSTGHKMLNKPVFVEQSGIMIRAWGGFPGGMTARFMMPVGLHNVCKMMSLYDDKHVEAVSVIAFTDGLIWRTFVGRLEGTIASEPRYGERLFSWDAILIPQGFTQTLSELGHEKTRAISMRRRSMMQFMQFLQANYTIT
ncbi:MAG: non-canonical purine NTP pyrophosphatase [Chloroflexota bacterium]